MKDEMSRLIQLVEAVWGWLERNTEVNRENYGNWTLEDDADRNSRREGVCEFADRLGFSNKDVERMFQLVQSCFGKCELEDVKSKVREANARLCRKTVSKAKAKSKK